MFNHKHTMKNLHVHTHLLIILGAHPLDVTVDDDKAEEPADFRLGLSI